MRSVNGTELYDLRTDPSQSINRTTDYPELVRELAAAYDQYWNDVSVGDEGYSSPVLGDPKAERMRLSTEHIMPDDDESIVWNQLQVESGERIWGFWPVEIRHAGESMGSVYYVYVARVSEES